MAQVFVGENEPMGSAISRFKQTVSKAGIFVDLRRTRHFETAAQKRLRRTKSKQKMRRHSSRC